MRWWLSLVNGTRFSLGITWVQIPPSVLRAHSLKVKCLVYTEEFLVQFRVRPYLAIVYQFAHVAVDDGGPVRLRVARFGGIG